MPLRKTPAAAAALAVLAGLALAGCSTQPVVPHYTEPEAGPKTAMMRVGGEGMIAVRLVEEDDAEFCWSWREDKNQVLYYLEGITEKAPETLPYQGRSAGMPASTATRRFTDKNRWAEFRIPAGKEIEIQYSLPYERIPGSKPVIKLGPDDEMPDDLGAICRAGFRFTPQPGKNYQAAFSWGGIQGDRTCGAIFTTEPDAQIVRMRRLQECHRIDYNNLLKFQLQQ